MKREIENKRLVVGADELGDDWGSGSGSRMAASGWFEREMLTLEFSAAHDDEIEDKS